jgi:hypothetical protein
VKFCLIRNHVYWGLWKVCKRRLWKWAFLSRGGTWAGSFTEDFERSMKKGSGNGVSL